MLDINLQQFNYCEPNHCHDASLQVLNQSNQPFGKRSKYGKSDRWTEDRHPDTGSTIGPGEQKKLNQQNFDLLKCMQLKIKVPQCFCL